MVDSVCRSRMLPKLGKATRKRRYGAIIVMGHAIEPPMLRFLKRLLMTREIARDCTKRILGEWVSTYGGKDGGGMYVRK